MSDERCPWCGEPYHTEEDGSTVYYRQHDPEECRDTLHSKLAAKNQEFQAACDVIEAAREVMEAAREALERVQETGVLLTTDDCLTLSFGLTGPYLLDVDDRPQPGQDERFPPG